MRSEAESRPDVPLGREALRQRPVTGIEVEFRDGETIVSSTDPQGRITYVNGYFIEISGYTEVELLGQPHRMIRHPDMPAAAFADMWATLKKGRPWVGMVKNRCKNGDHYWVEANVSPIYDARGQLEGYVSVRRKPTRTQVAEAERLYRDIREGRLKRFEIENGVVHPPSVARAFNPLWRLSLTLRLFLLALFGVGMAGLLLWLQAVGTGFGTLLGLLLAGAGFATYSAWWLSRDVVGRLARAKTLFREIAAEKHDGDVDISRADEVGAVLLGLKSLQVRLEFSTQRLRREAANASRINQALDMAETNIMVADRRFTVVFANRAVLDTFRKHEARIATAIPGFRADDIVGSSIDRFHKDPQHQGEFNPSSQHLLAGGDGEEEDPNIEGCFAGKAWLARTATRIASSGSMAVLASDRQRIEQRRCGHCRRCLYRCWNSMVQTMWRHATFASCAIGAAAHRPIPVTLRARRDRVVQSSRRWHPSDCSAARAIGLDHFARVAAKRCDSRRRARLPCSHSSVAC